MICVYQYGLASPHEELDRILDQMRVAHRYRNSLVEIERGRRAAERTMLAHHGPLVAEFTSAAESAEREVEAVVVEIRRERAKTHKRSESKELKDRLKGAKETKRACGDALRQARRELRESPAIIAERDRISELALSLVRDARAISGLARKGPHFGAWGTYQLVEEAAQASFADLPLYGADGTTPNDPHFLRWTGEGAVSVQIQGGATVEDVTGDHPQLRLTLPDERAWLKMPANGWSVRRRYARQGALRMCLGTDVEGSRIYSAWRLDMHRALPDKAVIKRATVHCRRVGPHSKWSLDLIVECPDRASVLATRGGAIAIDIGWRSMGDELRVAGWSDSSELVGEYRLDAKTIAVLREPEEIRSQRDSLFDLAILRLGTWVERFAELPEWMRLETKGLKQWKSAARLAGLANRWRENRFDRDEPMFSALQAWALADLHYWEQESRRREAALRRRREFYRVLSKRLVESYDTIVLEQFDLRVFAKRAPVDAGPENETARSNRQLAALSELRQCITNAARAEGRTVVAVPAHDTTRVCPVCGLVDDRPAAEHIVLTCECGASWDQDTTGAAVAILRRWIERPSDAKILVGARSAEKTNDSEDSKESRRARVTRMRLEKEARMGAARNEARTDAE